jgi:hypothetical protein
MANTEESSSKNDASHSTDGKVRSIADRLPMRPITAASRWMSSLLKQPRNTTSQRNYSIDFGNDENASFQKPLSEQTCSIRHRSSSASNDNPFNSTSSSPMRNSKTTPSGLDEMSKTTTTSTTPTTPTPDTVGRDFNFDSTYLQLRELADTNCKYFSQQKTDVCKRFERLLIQLLHSIDSSVPLIRYLTDNFHHFDYSPEV